MTEKLRCLWAQSDPLMTDYHDHEWGYVIRDSRKLWEALVLEGFQAGLSWRTVLYKRDAIREAFYGFDPQRVAAMSSADVARLLNNPGIIRARAKIQATIEGARIFEAMKKDGQDFGTWLWSLNGKPVKHSAPIPVETDESKELSNALKKRGFKFVGPKIVYAWMQAVGMVDDHSADCFRRK